jgi:regulator of protease activity HflC (stomatin/prohibitin superfamily)
MSRNDLLALTQKILGAVWQMILHYAQRHPWTIVAALYGMFWTFGVTVQTGQRGVLFRWGRVVKELEPGFHWLAPLMHTVRKIPVRSITIDLPGQKVMTAEGLVYDAGVNLVYRVEDATKALTLVDHLDSGCRAAIPIIVTEVLRARDQAELVDRASLDRVLADRIHAWIARWGLVVEQAGFTTIAPNRGVLGTTQLRARTIERTRALGPLLAAGLDAEVALALVGTERRPMAKSSRRYRLRTRQTGRTIQARRSSRHEGAVKTLETAVPTARTVDNPADEAPRRNLRGAPG